MARPQSQKRKRKPRRKRRPLSSEAIYVPEIEVTRRYGIPRKTLQARRATGRPPAYLKLDDTPKAAVLYSIQVIEAWLASRERRSTSDAGPEARP